MNKRKYIVYLYTCKINHKQYVGQTCNKYGMKGRAKNGSGYRSGAFYNAIKKYGWNNFDGIVLKDNLTKEEANYWETYYIKKYRTCIDYEDCNGYNMTEGGDGGEMLGYHHTDETKEKISNYFKGRFVGELNPMYGVHDNHICNEDGHLPKEIRDKLSVAMKNRFKEDKEFADKMQSYNENKMRAVNQYDLKGNFIKQFKSRNEAYHETGICAATIHKVCKRLITKNGSLSRTAGGFQWRFADDCDDIGEISYKERDLSTYKTRINQYTLDGKYITTYDSILNAHIATGANRSGIGSCCVGRVRKSGEFQWRYCNKEFPEGVDIEPIRKVVHNKLRKKILQCDLEGSVIRIYDSFTQASIESDCCSASIAKVLRGELKSTKGYIWRYANEEGEYYNDRKRA